jgi:6-phosphogluconolactonase (cycloisomerase 2 family)
LALSCSSPSGQSSPTTGSITGKATYAGLASSAGIFVSAESTDGVRSLAVQQLLAGKPSSRTISGVTATSANGAYSLDGLSPGTYTVYATSPDSLEKAVSAQAIVTAGGTATPASMTLTPTGSIAGTATLGSAATGASGIVVFVAGTSYSALTADDGEYTIGGVPVGTDYTVTAQKTGYVPASTHVDVALGAKTAASALSLSPPTATTGSIAGKATLGGAAADANAFIFIYLQGAPSEVAATADDGSYTLSGVAPGNYTLVASKVGYVDATESVAVSASSTPVAAGALVLSETAPSADALAVLTDLHALAIGYATGDTAASVTADLGLATSGSSGTSIAWASSDSATVSTSGKVARPDYSASADAVVSLTATVTKGSESGSTCFTVTVKRAPQTDGEAVAADKASLAIGFYTGDSAASVKGDLTLPSSGSCGTTITWASSAAAIVSATGTVRRPSDADTSVTLTVTLAKGSFSGTKGFGLTVKRNFAAIYCANPTDNTISAFSIDPASGALSHIGLYNTGSLNAPTALAATPGGTYLYAANTGGATPEISGYEINSTTGALTALGLQGACGTSISNTATIAIDPSGSYLYAGGDGIYCYKIGADGLLSPLTGTNYSNGHYQLIASYVTDGSSKSTCLFANVFQGVDSFKIDSATGAIDPSDTSVTHQTNGLWSWPSMTVDPAGTRAYIFDSNGSTSWTVCFINPSNGQFSSSGLSGTSSGEGYNPEHPAVDPSGRYLYVGDNSGFILGYSISDSGLTELSSVGSPWTCKASFPGDIVFDPTGSYLYVVACDTSLIYGFAIDKPTGKLTALTSGPQSNGTWYVGSSAHDYYDMLACVPITH